MEAPDGEGSAYTVKTFDGPTPPPPKEGENEPVKRRSFPCDGSNYVPPLPPPPVTQPSAAEKRAAELLESHRVEGKPAKSTDSDWVVVGEEEGEGGAADSGAEKATTTPIADAKPRDSFVNGLLYEID